MTNLQQIFFVYSESWGNPEFRGSAIMRALVPSNYLNKVNFKSYVSSRLDENLVKQNDIVIFVKCYNHQDIQIAKRKKCIVVYDPVDDYSTFVNNKFDIIIAATKSHKEYINSRYQINNERIAIIDHMHTNFTRITVKNRDNNDIKNCTIGAVEPQGLLSVKLLTNFIDFCRFENINFKLIDSLKSNLVYDSRIGTKNLFENYMDIDIGISLFDNLSKKSFFERIKYKPSTKLSAFASYGIPAICFYQESYDPVLDLFPELENLLIDNINNLQKKLLNLIYNLDYYYHCKSMFLQIGEYFHIKNVSNRYINQINSINKKMKEIREIS